MRTGSVPSEIRAPSNRPVAGASLLIVMGLLFLSGALAAWLAASSNSHLLRNRSLVRMEQAAYIAEGGVERGASHLAANGVVPETLRGNLGAGRYVTMVLSENTEAGVVGALSGRININPGNNTNFAFYAERPDGSRISHVELMRNAPDYNGPAVLVGVQPTGSGQQDQLRVRGMTYTITNAFTYGFRSTNMNVRIWNDGRTADGRATGLWWIEFNSTNASTTSAGDPRPLRRSTSFTIFSAGYVQNQVRPVTVRGVTSLRWSRYALWYDQEAMQIWFTGGEQFRGLVYSRPTMRFHSFRVAPDGQTLFTERVLTCATNYIVENETVRPNFQRGITFRAPTQNLSSINLALLRDEADMVFTGTTYIALASNRMFVTNARHMWTNRSVTITNENLIYIATADSGDTNSRPGHLYISAVTGLAGRVAFVADQDIYVTNHVRLARNPVTVPTSTDLLGLIAGANTVVATNAPNNLEIYAHIICRDGGFGVAEYNNPRLGSRGTLTVYGGVVNLILNPVGTSEGLGYRRNYTFDSRLRNHTPPRYPSIPDIFTWQDWDG